MGGEHSELIRNKKASVQRPEKSCFALRLFSAPLLRSRQVLLSPTHLEALTFNVMTADRSLSDVYRMNGSRVGGLAIIDSPLQG
jgi:hypothetical protein